VAASLNPSLMDLGLEALVGDHRAEPAVPATAVLGGVVVAALAIGAAARTYWYGVRWREPVRGPRPEGAPLEFVEGYIPYIGPCVSMASAEAWVERHADLPPDAESLTIRRGPLAAAPGVEAEVTREARRRQDVESGFKCFWPSVLQVADVYPKGTYPSPIRAPAPSAPPAPATPPP